MENQRYFNNRGFHQRGGGYYQNQFIPPFLVQQQPWANRGNRGRASFNPDYSNRWRGKARRSCRYETWNNNHLDDIYMPNDEHSSVPIEERHLEYERLISSTTGMKKNSFTYRGGHSYRPFAQYNNQRRDYERNNNNRVNILSDIKLQPEKNPERNPETIAETIPEAIPETTPEALPEKNPEILPETIPEALPETTVDAVMEEACEVIDMEIDEYIVVSEVEDDEELDDKAYKKEEDPLMIEDCQMEEVVVSTPEPTETSEEVVQDNEEELSIITDCQVEEVVVTTTEPTKPNKEVAEDKKQQSLAKRVEDIGEIFLKTITNLPGNLVTKKPQRRDPSPDFSDLNLENLDTTKSYLRRRSTPKKTPSQESSWSTENSQNSTGPTAEVNSSSDRSVAPTKKFVLSLKPETPKASAELGDKDDRLLDKDPPVQAELPPAPPKQTDVPTVEKTLAPDLVLALRQKVENQKRNRPAEVPSVEAFLMEMELDISPVRKPRIYDENKSSPVGNELTPRRNLEALFTNHHKPDKIEARRKSSFEKSEKTPEASTSRRRSADVFKEDIRKEECIDKAKPPKKSEDKAPKTIKKCNVAISKKDKARVDKFNYLFEDLQKPSKTARAPTEKSEKKDKYKSSSGSSVHKKSQSLMEERKTTSSPLDKSEPSRERKPHSASAERKRSKTPSPADKHVPAVEERKRNKTPAPSDKHAPPAEEKSRHKTPYSLEKPPEVRKRSKTPSSDKPAPQVEERKRTKTPVPSVKPVPLEEKKRSKTPSPSDKPAPQVEDRKRNKTPVPTVKPVPLEKKRSKTPSPPEKIVPLVEQRQPPVPSENLVEEKKRSKSPSATEKPEKERSKTPSPLEKPVSLEERKRSKTPSPLENPEPSVEWKPHAAVEEKKRSKTPSPKDRPGPPSSKSAALEERKRSKTPSQLDKPGLATENKAHSQFEERETVVQLNACLSELDIPSPPPPPKIRRTSSNQASTSRPTSRADEKRTPSRRTSFSSEDQRTDEGTKIWSGAGNLTDYKIPKTTRGRARKTMSRADIQMLNSTLEALMDFEGAMPVPNPDHSFSEEHEEAPSTAEDDEVASIIAASLSRPCTRLRSKSMSHLVKEAETKRASRPPSRCRTATFGGRAKSVDSSSMLIYTDFRVTRSMSNMLGLNNGFSNDTRRETYEDVVCYSDSDDALNQPTVDDSLDDADRSQQTRKAFTEEVSYTPPVKIDLSREFPTMIYRDLAPNDPRRNYKRMVPFESVAIEPNAVQAKIVKRRPSRADRPEDAEGSKKKPRTKKHEQDPDYVPPSKLEVPSRSSAIEAISETYHEDRPKALPTPKKRRLEKYRNEETPVKRKTPNTGISLDQAIDMMPGTSEGGTMTLAVSHTIHRATQNRDVFRSECNLTKPLSIRKPHTGKAAVSHVEKLHKAKVVTTTSSIPEVLKTNPVNLEALSQELFQSFAMSNILVEALCKSMGDESVLRKTRDFRGTVTDSVIRFCEKIIKQDMEKEDFVAFFEKLHGKMTRMETCNPVELIRPTQDFAKYLEEVDAVSRAKATVEDITGVQTPPSSASSIRSDDDVIFMDVDGGQHTPTNTCPSFSNKSTKDLQQLPRHTPRDISPSLSTRTTPDLQQLPRNTPPNLLTPSSFSTRTTPEIQQSSRSVSSLHDPILTSMLAMHATSLSASVPSITVPPNTVAPASFPIPTFLTGEKNPSVDTSVAATPTLGQMLLRMSTVPTSSLISGQLNAQNSGALPARVPTWLEMGASRLRPSQPRRVSSSTVGNSSGLMTNSAIGTTSSVVYMRARGATTSMASVATSSGVVTTPAVPARRPQQNALDQMTSMLGMPYRPAAAPATTVSMTPIVSGPPPSYENSRHRTMASANSTVRTTWVPPAQQASDVFSSSQQPCTITKQTTASQQSHIPPLPSQSSPYMTAAQRSQFLTQVAIYKEIMFEDRRLKLKLMASNTQKASNAQKPSNAQMVSNVQKASDARMASNAQIASNAQKKKAAPPRRKSTVNILTPSKINATISGADTMETPRSWNVPVETTKTGSNQGKVTVDKIVEMVTSLQALPEPQKDHALKRLDNILKADFPNLNNTGASAQRGNDQTNNITVTGLLEGILSNPSMQLVVEYLQQQSPNRPGIDRENSQNSEAGCPQRTMVPVQATGRPSVIQESSVAGSSPQRRQENPVDGNGATKTPVLQTLMNTRICRDRSKRVVITSNKDAESQNSIPSDRVRSSPGAIANTPQSPDDVVPSLISETVPPQSEEDSSSTVANSPYSDISAADTIPVDNQSSRLVPTERVGSACANVDASNDDVKVALDVNDPLDIDEFVFPKDEEEECAEKEDGRHLEFVDAEEYIQQNMEPEDPVPRNQSVDSGVSSPTHSPLDSVDTEEVKCEVCSGTALFICSCQSVRYCSVDCQSTDWAAHMKVHA